MKLKLLPLKDVVWDREIYPRQNINLEALERYENAMENGAVFPPIVVAKLNGRYVIVDGVHRWAVRRKRKEKYIQCEILNLKTEEEIYAESIRRNVIHGQNFTQFEINQVIEKLKDYNFTPVSISDIVKVPQGKLKKYFASKIIGRVGAPIKHEVVEFEVTPILRHKAKKVSAALVKRFKNDKYIQKK